VIAPPELNLPPEYPWGVAVVHAGDGRMLLANQSMAELYSCHPADRWAELFSFTNGQSFSQVAARTRAGAIWTGRIDAKRSRHAITSVEVMLQRDASDPDRIWLYTLEHPRVNNQVRFSSRSELQMLRVLLDNTLEYVFFRDLEGHFILTNKAFHEAAANAGEFPDVGNRLQDFISVRSAEWFAGLDAQVNQSGRPVINEVGEVFFHNGIKHWLQLTTVPVRSGEGETIGTLSVARDISDLKRTEAELRLAIERANQASKAKGQFLAAMSHEIRTPINGIIGASELCQETRLDAEQRSYVDTVVQGGNTLLSLVNDVLDFSKIEAGQLNLEKLNFSPLQMMESVAEECGRMLRDKDVDLIVVCDEDVPLYLMGDPTRVKQVLYNLVGNAVKFTEKGEIVIRAEPVEVQAEAARVRFSVQDTGIGIAESRREAIFESFTQADMSTSRKYGGTGLGLTICRELVQLMGGRIEVASTEGEGSTFSFDLPFERTKLIGAESVPFNPELAGMRVLIVDDNPTNREIYAQMCAGWGYRSASAPDAQAAIQQLEEAARENEPFALIILDQQMPGLTGLDLAGVIKARPDLSSSRIIMLSSSLDCEESARAEEIGVARALSKPVKRATLLEVILETFDVGGGDQTAAAPSTPPEERPVRSLHVLLAEDNPVNQAVATKRLEKLGHRVTLAPDGLKAAEFVEERTFDGILMDIQMPQMDGFEATARIREIEQAQGRPPHWIVSMTAHALKGDKEKCLQAGMDDYIAKPFRVERLKEVLSDMARKSAPSDDPASDPASALPSGLEQFMKQLDEDEQEDLLAAAEIFIDTLPEEIAKLEDAVQRNDPEGVYFMAHSLKSVTGVFGHNESIRLSEALEHAAQSKPADPSRLVQLADQLIAALRDLAREIEAIASGSEAEKG